MEANGSDAIQLTDNDAEDSFVRWSPDGNYLAFVSNRDGDPEIYLMDVSNLPHRRRGSS